MDSQSADIDSANNAWNHKPHDDHNDMFTLNATNPNYHSTSTTATASHQWETSNPVMDSLASHDKNQLKKGQRQAEDIFTKTKKIVKQHWEQARHSLVQAHKMVGEMVPKQANHFIYWRNPIQSGVVFGLLLSAVITFMFLSSLAALSFWLLTFLTLIGLYKLYNYVMATFVGRFQDDLFDSIFPPDMNISERQAQALATSIRVNGTNLLKLARNLFLWKNLTNSVLFGLTLFLFFYIGLSMNALTFALVGLIVLFTVPKIYQVYQVPIDRTAKQVLDKINQLLAKVTSKFPTKPKTT